ncbi:MbtH family protein [Endothiovibrio diazotrophicus]
MSPTTAPLPPTTDEAPAATTHRVLVNHEEQYCLWPAEKAIPAGWSETFNGPRQACLDHIEAVWTDMRPKSVRD